MNPFAATHVPASMEAIPARLVRDREMLETVRRERFVENPAAFRNRYASQEERDEARRRTWRAYAARNRGARVESTQRWRAKTAEMNMAIR